jgi:hypothetical protein
MENGLKTIIEAILYLRLLIKAVYVTTPTTKVVDIYRFYEQILIPI